MPDEKFLVLVNDLLASGEIPELIPEDEVENIISGVRSEVKSVGLEDTRENCWKFFIERVRRQLKVSVLSLRNVDTYNSILFCTHRLCYVSRLLERHCVFAVASFLPLKTAHRLIGFMSGRKKLLDLSVRHSCR